MHLLLHTPGFDFQAVLACILLKKKKIAVCSIIAEAAAQVAGQLLLGAVMRCLCPFLHGIPPAPLLEWTWQVG